MSGARSKQARPFPAAAETGVGAPAGAAAESGAAGIAAETGPAEATAESGATGTAVERAGTAAGIRGASPTGQCGGGPSVERAGTAAGIRGGGTADQTGGGAGAGAGARTGAGQGQTAGLLGDAGAATGPAVARAERRRLYKKAATLFAFSFIVLALFAGPRFFRQSQAPHFVYQADAFVHGRLALRVDPPNLNDWVKQGDKWYVSFPPFPAVLMAPFVALHGLQFNDVPFTIFFGALNAALLFLWLRLLAARGEQRQREKDDLLLACFFLFGTVNFYSSIRGEVWFTALVVGQTMLLGYLMAAHQARHPVWAGFFLACATLSRTTMAFAVISMLWEVWKLDAPWSVRTRRLALFAAPLFTIGLAQAWMNWARFGDPLVFGHELLYQNRVNERVARWGLFDLHYLEQNLHAAFTRLPIVERNPLRISYDLEGMSLFITTPLYIWLLWPRERPRLHRPLWLSVAAVGLPSLFYMNTGWVQFGYRFSLDYTPLLFTLLALGGRASTPSGRLLGLAGVGVNLWGALTFGRG